MASAQPVSSKAQKTGLAAITNPQPSPLASIFGKAHANQLPDLPLQERLLLVRSSPNMADEERQEEIQRILKLIEDDKDMPQLQMSTSQPAPNQLGSIPPDEHACSSRDAPLPTDPDAEEYLSQKEKENRKRQRAEISSRRAKEISLMETKLSAWQQVYHCLVDPDALAQHPTARLTQAHKKHLNQSNLYEDEGHDLRDDRGGPRPHSPMRTVRPEETVRFIFENVNFHPHESILVKQLLKAGPRMYSLCFAKILEVVFRDQPLLLMISVCTNLPEVGPFPSTADALDLISSSRHSYGSRKLPVVVYNFANFPTVQTDAKHNPVREEATKKMLMGLLDNTRNDYSDHPDSRVQLVMIFRQQKKLALSGGVVTSFHRSAAAPAVPAPGVAPAKSSAATQSVSSVVAPAVFVNNSDGKNSYLEAWKDAYSIWDSQVSAPLFVQQGAAQLVGVVEHEYEMSPKVSTSEESAQRLCGKCRQPGHNRNNRLCPLFG